MPSPPAISQTALLQLGKFGDIANILPVARDMARVAGKPVPFVVAREFASILEGVSYVAPDVIAGSWTDYPGAMNTARSKYSHVLATMPAVRGLKYDRVTSSFNKESWRLAGYLQQWGKLPLVFDCRNLERESELARAKLSPTKLNLLVNTLGYSSPLHEKALITTLLDGLTDKWHVVDLSAFKCYRIYDQVGLMDAADLLLTIDTASLHLAHASNVPVIALLQGEALNWSGTEPLCRCTLQLRYTELASQLGAVAQAIKQAAIDATRTIWHVANHYPSTGDARRRDDVARLTWAKLYAADSNFREVVFHGYDAPRTGKSVGDKLPVPFVKDVIEAAAVLAGEDDIIALSNTDSCFLASMPRNVRREVSRYGCYYSHRTDLPNIVAPLEPWQIAGAFYMGADLFAFTKPWWRANREEFPDALIGREGWDYVLKRMMQRTGFRAGTIQVYHEAHESDWEVNIDSPGQRHNRQLCSAWAKANGFTRDIRTGGRALFSAC